MNNYQGRARIFAGTQTGKELLRMEDEYSSIIVSQRGDKRILSFGTNMEQSCVLMSKPYYLFHEYMQLMLLGMIFNNASRVTLCGLGAGSLPICLAHYFPSLQIDVVELRQSVIDVAYKWFPLPENSHLRIIQNDAYEYLQHAPPNSTDIIFSDLYDSNGMSKIQSDKSFINASYESLSPDGCLVLNLHADPAADLSLTNTLLNVFTSVRVCNIVDGNWVLFCEKNNQPMNENQLEKNVRQLSDQVKMPLRYYFKNMSLIL